jgi:hypothetical protein
MLAQNLAPARHVAVAHFHKRDAALNWLLQDP